MKSIILSKQSVIQRFLSKIEKTDFCWNWKASKDKEGYGYFWDHKTLKAHRFSYELFKDKIPNNLQIDHLCRNPSCVNPNHLEIVTSKENTYRGNSFQGINSRKIHCIRNHPLSGNNLYVRPNNSRVCRICQRLSDRKHRQKIKSNPP